MARSSIKPVQKAVIRIGYMDLLMPADKALEVLKLMQHAVAAEREWTEHKTIYIAKPEELEITFKHVSDADIRIPHGDTAPATPAQRRLLK